MERVITQNRGYEQDSRSKEFGYLAVDSFIKDIVDARALATALELRLIDYLVKNQSVALDELKKGFKGNARGAELLINLLIANNIIEESDGEVRLTQPFVKALRYRDLLEVKLEFVQFVLPDFMDLFTTLIHSPDRLGSNDRISDFFCYHRGFEATPENYELTKRWMRITTTFTKYEAQVCMKYHDFSRYRCILDIGGNSGEFVRQVFKRYPRVLATVFDLPLVCDIGLEHIRSEPEAGRISFIKGNALTDPFPEGFDLVTFKSMLHDWPEKEAKQFIEKASHSLDPGGTLLIFERGPLEVGNTTMSYSIIPILLFFHSFRSPVLYEAHLKDLGFKDIKIEKIDLETPFYLVTAKKKN